MAVYRRKLSPLKTNELIDYKDVELLGKFLTEQGKILPRKVTGLTTKQQTKLTSTSRSSSYNNNNDQDNNNNNDNNNDNYRTNIDDKTIATTTSSEVVEEAAVSSKSTSEFDRYNLITPVVYLIHIALFIES